MTKHRDNRFVAHLDVLGTSVLTKRDPDRGWAVISDLARVLTRRGRMGIQRPDSDRLIIDQVQSFLFSDTIVLFSRADSDDDVLAMVVTATELFAHAIHKCVPLRGGIAFGRFAYDLDLNLFSGPALVDAHAIGEPAQWLGIVVDDYTAETFCRLPAITSRFVVPWDVVRKDETRRQMVVNWAESHRRNYQGPFPLTAEAFYRPFEPIFGRFDQLGPREAAKYENTVAFFNKHYRPY